MNNLERELQAAIVKGANLEGFALFKLVDGAEGKRPSDVAGLRVDDGKAVLLEVKMVAAGLQQDSPIPWRLFRRHQVGWLKKYAEADAHSIAVLSDRSVTVAVLLRPWSFETPSSPGPPLSSHVTARLIKKGNVVLGLSRLFP